MFQMLVPVLALSLALAEAPATAAQDPSVRQDLAITRAQIQADRKAIVSASLPLTDEQAKAFWPLYDGYRADMGKLGDKLQELILSYAKDWNADKVTDESAGKMLDSYLALRQDEAAMQAQWAKKLQAKLPATVVARFFQIENRLDLIVREDIATGVPLVPPAK